MRQVGWRLKVKRALDLAVGGTALVAAAPAMAAVAVAVRASLGSPVLFRQERPGLHGRPFQFLKFRSMRDAVGPDGRSLSDAERLTRLGRFLRSTSLDELPQLVNVIRGEMSLVGPRPLLMHYLPRYTPTQARRHEVLPGITGVAQTGGRNSLSWDEKFAMDVWYVDNWSLGLDVALLAKTAWHVVRRSGVSHEGHATMPEFRGTATNGAASHT